MSQLLLSLFIDFTEQKSTFWLWTTAATDSPRYAFAGVVGVSGVRVGMRCRSGLAFHDDGFVALISISRISKHLPRGQYVWIHTLLHYVWTWYRIQ